MKKIHQFLMTFWIAMFLSIGLYYAVCRMQPAGIYDASSRLPIILLGSSLSLVAMSVILKKRLLERAAREGSVTVLRSAFVVPLVFAQAVALFGLLVHFAVGWPLYWLFIALGAGSMLLNFPKRGEVERVAR